MLEKFDSSGLLNIKELDDTGKIFWGIVTAINPEKNTMTVDIKTNSGKTHTVPDIQINNIANNLGIGFKFMPVPQQTTVFLYRDVNNLWIHLGYYSENSGKFTSDKTGTKQKNHTLLLQRYLEGGELQIIGAQDNEILFTNDGNILIKTKSNFFVYLDDYLNNLEIVVPNCLATFDRVRIRSGNIIRYKDINTNEAVQYYLKDDIIVTDSDIKYTDIVQPLKEFSVQVGTVQNGNTGFDIKSNNPDVMLSPNVGFLNLSDKVINESGEEEKINLESLHFLLRLTSGIGLGISKEGTFYLYDYTTHGYIQFTTGAEDSSPLTALECVIGTSITNINSDGSISYVNGDNEISQAIDGSTVIKNSNATITIGNDGKVSITTGNDVSVNAENVEVNSTKADINSDEATINSAKASITGGELTVNGVAAPTGSGPFCGIPTCLLTGAQHIGNKVTGT